MVLQFPPFCSSSGSLSISLPEYSHHNTAQGHIACFHINSIDVFQITFFCWRTSLQFTKMLIVRCATLYIDDVVPNHARLFGTYRK